MRRLAAMLSGMKLADLLAGSKTHTLDSFPPTVVANVEKRLADKDGKPVLRCLVRDKVSAELPTPILNPNGAVAA